ncbi:MAG: hypothetical protein BAJATHORv1_20293 [Candidatus Thorarchaeota archaeon]|nr:MAG: hypothetical protein BAJATHORv1_20293 [Candidatus Thorarchaeota archaeon]
MFHCSFTARGHENILATHKTTLELTSEKTLTKRGNCIVGVASSLTLDQFDQKIKKIVKSENTRIILHMNIDSVCEVIEGRGSRGLTYTDQKSMVIRKSSFECDRTLMVNADKASVDLKRDFVQLAKDPRRVILCKIDFLIE